MYTEILILGVFLWANAHWVKRLTPNLRVKMDDSLGAGPARGIIAALIFVSIVMMVIGYRNAEIVLVYNGFNGAGHLNNLMMVVAVVLLGMGSSKGRMKTMLRHPMLLGVTTWAIAHLLVNGDLSSIILFGGIGFWALMSMVLVNRAEGAWKVPVAGPPAGDIRLIVISIVVFTVIASIHIMLGYNPFLGNY